MIARHERCVGLSLPAIGWWKIELWFCPPNYQIEKHSHPNVDIRLFFIFGNNSVFCRERNNANGIERVSKTIKWWHFGRSFRIKRNDLHYFTVSRLPLIFFNVERWYCKPTSAAEDFEIETT